MKNILITGGLGFIGFNAIQLWKQTRPEYNYFIVDSETYASKFMLDEKKNWLRDNDVPYFKTNICDEFTLDTLVVRNEIDTIVNFAAESHVDNSISNPSVFFQTNVIGTASLLNIANRHKLRFHQIGTDEVYGETRPEDWQQIIMGVGIRYTPAEEKLLVPSSPYSSSKASADMIALSYHHTFGTDVTISRCSNNAGKWQHPEKLIGTVISKALADLPIPVYGEGNQRRHWISVDDHNAAIMDILENGEIGKTYNIGPDPDNWITNIQMIKFILSYLKKPESLITHITDRLGHDTSYFLYPTRPMKTQKYVEFMPSIIDWYETKLSKR